MCCLVSSKKPARHQDILNNQTECVPGTSFTISTALALGSCVPPVSSVVIFVLLCEKEV